MPSHILSIASDTLPATSVASLLPCRIRHDGHIEQAGAYWKPRTSKCTIVERDTQQCEQNITPTFSSPSKEAFFRGRKLKGREVALPKQYEGVVLQRATTNPTQTKGTDVAATERDDECENSTVGEAFQVLSRFDEVVVWAQDCSGGDTSDLYTRSLDEWLRTASKIPTESRHTLNLSYRSDVDYCLHLGTVSSERRSSTAAEPVRRIATTHNSSQSNVYHI